MTTESEFEKRTREKGEAFIAAVKAVMREHGVTDINIELEYGNWECNGAHINIEFAEHYFGTHEVKWIDTK